MASVFRVRTIITGVQGAPYYSNQYWTGSVPADAGVAHAGVAALWNNLRTHMKTGASITTEADIAEIDVGSGLQVGNVVATNITVTGNDATDMLPPANQALLRFRTGAYLSGREIKGRIFVPAQMEGDCVNGQLQGPYITFLTGVLATYLASGVPGSNAPAIYARPFPPKPPKPGRAVGVAAEITAASAWNQFAILRSRRD